MALAFFLCPYKRDTLLEKTRYCAMRDQDAAILADRGAWSESEVAGNQAVVKVRANPATLAVIGATAGYSTVTRAQAQALIAAGRLKPRYDRATDTIILDGPAQPSKPFAMLDREVV